MGKKKKPTIFRSTISIPYGLKERMDASGASVNWSSIAVRAFEAKLAEIAGAKKEKNMGDVIQRLRASKNRAEDGRYNQGAKDGRSWAKEFAEANELEKLAEIIDGRDWEDWFRGESAFCWGDLLLQEISENYSGRNDDFWESVAGDGWKELSNDPSYVKGFAEAAAMFWDEVKDQL